MMEKNILDLVGNANLLWIQTYIEVCLGCFVDEMIKLPKMNYYYLRIVEVIAFSSCHDS